MVRVEIYTTEFCPFCDRAKWLIKQKGFEYDEHRLDELDDRALHEKMMSLSGQRTVPQIVIDGKSIGGWRELSELDRTGALDSILNGTAA